MKTIDSIFAENIIKPSDINQHLVMLYTLAATCSRVTEFGIRGGVSTSAFLAAMQSRARLGLEARYNGFDINPACLQVFEGLMQHVPDKFNHACFVADTTKMDPIPFTDMLFIDTLHNGEVVEQELIRHANRVADYIVFHDTITFGLNGETPGKAGLWDGMQKGFASINSVWRMCYSSSVNNGLTVYRRVE